MLDFVFTLASQNPTAVSSRINWQEAVDTRRTRSGTNQQSNINAASLVTFTPFPPQPCIYSSFSLFRRLLPQTKDPSFPLPIPGFVQQSLLQFVLGNGYISVFLALSSCWAFAFHAVISLHFKRSKLFSTLKCYFCLRFAIIFRFCGKIIA